MYQNGIKRGNKEITCEYEACREYRKCSGGVPQGIGMFQQEATMGKWCGKCRKRFGRTLGISEDFRKVKEGHRMSRYHLEPMLARNLNLQDQVSFLSTLKMAEG